VVKTLVDRDAEATRLREAALNAPQLVVLRGQHRVGKSYLIDRALQGFRQVSFQADEQDERGHLDLLAREAARLLPGAPPLRFDDWDAAFTYFGGQAEQEPLVVVLDEFQWLWGAQPALDSII
jgi:AAA+ ATPase superfamily predicted ATPase